MDEPSEASQKPLIKKETAHKHSSPASEQRPVSSHHKSSSGKREHHSQRPSGGDNGKGTEEIEKIARPISARPAGALDTVSLASGNVLRLSEVSAILFETRASYLKLDRGGKFVMQVREAPHSFAGPLGVWAGTVGSRFLDEKIWSLLEPLDGKLLPAVADKKDLVVETLMFTMVKATLPAVFGAPANTFPVCNKEVYKDELMRPWNGILDEMRAIMHSLRYSKDGKLSGLTVLPIESWRMALSGKEQSLKLTLSGKATLSEVKIRTMQKQGSPKEMYYNFTEKKWRDEPSKEKVLHPTEDGWSVDLPKAAVPTSAELIDGVASTQLLVWRRNDLCLMFDLPLPSDHTKLATCAFKK